MLPDKEYAQLTANARLLAFVVVREVRLMRQARGMTQAELGAKIGVTQSTISEWENGVTMPQLNSLLLVCMVLEIPFVFGTGGGRALI